MDIMIIYTDASNSSQKKISIIGYKLNWKIHTKIIKDITNTGAKFMAVIFALESHTICKDDSIIIFTDLYENSWSCK